MTELRAASAIDFTDEIDKLVVAFAATFEDGRVSVAEVWSLVVAITAAVKSVIEDVQYLDEDDLDRLTESVQIIYDRYVAPLDLPGPDFVVDPLLRNVVLPGAIQGIWQLINRERKMIGA